ncbi:hypothetical protein [Brachybacterium vulturis]|uniref:hypothetical protein n=1 Tax=Brachybacterium vulturis TaxID=2017484 RepID=UPI00373575CC
MGLSFPVIAFLVLAVLLAVGILVVVAMPHLRGTDRRADPDDADRQESPSARHTSRTGR